MVCDHISDVREIADKAISEINENGANAVGSTVNALKSFKDEINAFFSTSCGEGTGIKALYTKVGNIFDGKIKATYDLQDLNMALHLYMEFLDGMRGFINNEIASAKNTQIDVEAESQKIQEMTEKDKQFIDSIFSDGGSNKTIGNVSLADGLKNLEVLIDFIPMLSDMEARINEISSSDTNISQILTQFYARSVVDFSCRMITAVMETYKILNGSTCDVEKKPSEQDKFSGFKLL